VQEGLDGNRNNSSGRNNMAAEAKKARRTASFMWKVDGKLTAGVMAASPLQSGASTCERISSNWTLEKWLMSRAKPPELYKDST
jgi:hypothetical protein